MFVCLECDSDLILNCVNFFCTVLYFSGPKIVTLVTQLLICELVQKKLDSET
jgi:hypothetical protein